MGEASALLGGFTLTEAPRWHDGRIWFSDLYVHRVCSAEEDGSDLRTEIELPDVPSSYGWLPDGRLIVVLQEQQQIVRREPDGSLVPHADLSAHAKHQCNEMVIAPDGTAYVGCFGFDLYSNPTLAPAPLMRITSDGSVSVVGEPLYFPNGATIIDGRTLVVAETFANRLSQFEILADGTLSDRRDWATFGPLPAPLDLKEREAQLDVLPDGISGVDAEGAIWIGDFTKRQAMRVRSGGEILDTVSTADGLTCFAVALGGVDGRTLFLCANPDELDPEVRKNEPRSEIQSFRVEVPLATA